MSALNETDDELLTATNRELSELNAELDKIGAPPGQTLQGRLRDLRRAQTKAAEELAATHASALAACGAVRRKLPKERKSVTRKIQIGTDNDMYVTVGLYDDGTPGETFVKMATQGSMLSGLMDAFAIAVSIGLQYGVPLEKFCDKFQRLKFEPAGMTGQEDMPMVSSPVDAVFKWIALRFLP